jgi:hypothetical protein
LGNTHRNVQDIGPYRRCTLFKQLQLVNLSLALAFLKAVTRDRCSRWSILRRAPQLLQQYEYMLRTGTDKMGGIKDSRQTRGRGVRLTLCKQSFLIVGRRWIGSFPL